MVVTIAAHLEGRAVNQAKEGNCAPSPKPLGLPPPLSRRPRNKRSPGRQQPHSADKQGAGVGCQLLRRGQEEIRLGLYGKYTNSGLVCGARLYQVSSRQVQSTLLQMARPASTKPMQPVPILQCCGPPDICSPQVTAASKPQL